MPGSPASLCPGLCAGLVIVGVGSELILGAETSVIERLTASFPGGEVRYPLLSPMPHDATVGSPADATSAFT